MSKLHELTLRGLKETRIWNWELLTLKCTGVVKYEQQILKERQIVHRIQTAFFKSDIANGVCWKRLINYLGWKYQKKGQQVTKPFPKQVVYDSGITLLKSDRILQSISQNCLTYLTAGPNSTKVPDIRGNHLKTDEAVKNPTERTKASNLIGKSHLSALNHPKLKRTVWN